MPILIFMIGKKQILGTLTSREFVRNIFIIDTVKVSDDDINVVPTIEGNYGDLVRFQADEQNCGKLDRRYPEILPHVLSFCQSTKYAKKLCEINGLDYDKICKRSFIKITNQHKTDKKNKATKLEELLNKYKQPLSGYNLRARKIVIRNSPTIKSR